MNTRLALAGIAGVTILFLGLGIFASNDQRAIRKRLAAIATAASIDSKQSLFMRQVQGVNLRDYFAPDVVLKYRDRNRDEETVRSRPELLELITAARSTLHQASFRFTQIQIKVERDRTSAIVHAWLEADLNDERNSMSDELDLIFKKVDHQWIISEIETSASPVRH